MKKIIALLAFTLSLSSLLAQKTIICIDSTLWLKNFESGTLTQLTRLVPSPVGQTNKVVMSSGTGFTYSSEVPLYPATFVAGINYLAPNGSAAAGNLTGTTLNSGVTASSLTSTGIIISGGLGTGSVIGGATMNLGSDAQGDIYYRGASGVLTRLPAGTAGQYLATGGPGANPSYNTLSAVTNVLNVVTLGSAFSSTIVTEATVTGMSFAVTAGKNYSVEVIGSYQTAATTTGGELGFFLSASGVGTIVGNAEGGIVNTAAATSLSQQISAIGAADLAGSNLITTGVTAINSPHYIKAKVIFQCSTSGTFNVGWASEVASSAAQLNAGSTLIYQQLN